MKICARFFFRPSAFLFASVLTLFSAFSAPGQIPVVTNVLHTFGVATNDCQNPTGTLLLGADKVLYGTAYGSSNTSQGGAIFKMNLDGSGYSVIHSFTSQDTDDILSASLYYLIGLTITPEVNGVIYGTTLGSGSGLNPNGTIFRINTDGTGFTNIHSFSAADGNPWSITFGNDGVLYGAGNALFKLFIDGSGYTVLHTFNTATDGGRPVGRLIQGPDGELYGATFFEGPNNRGTIYKSDTAGTNFTVLYTFTNSLNGAQPTGPLLLGQDGALYGTASTGGSNAFGAVFKISTDGSNYQPLYSFGAGEGDGERPHGGLVQDAGGILYGTTENTFTNDPNMQGTIYKINPDGSGYSTLLVGSLSLGNSPFEGLVQGSLQSTGLYYGAMSARGVVNGDSEYGTLFSVAINPPLSISPPVTQAGASGPVVFWPTWALGYQLQSATNLNSPQWISVTNGFPVFGIQITNGPPNAFYRLVYP